MNILYVVRIVQTRSPEGIYYYEGGNIDAFIECLRYSGLIVIHEIDPYGYGLTTLCFDLLPPKDQRETSKEWSEYTALRMRYFGYNAISAPGT